MRDQPLTESEVAAGLHQLPGWARAGDALVKEYSFRNFRDAFSFMTRVAFEAETRDHHPEWTNVYSSVSIRLTTHHAGNRITAKDLDLAGAIERARAGFPVGAD